MDLRDKIYISTIAPDAVETATRYGLGLEIAQFCTAWNMDYHFPETDREVRSALLHTDRAVFHAPFNELCPAAIDLRIRQVAKERYHQAVALSKGYGISRIVVHSGYIPTVYYPEWFVEQSITFWKDLLSELPDSIELLLENVMEQSPDMLCRIAEEVCDPRFKLCLDLGHANAALSRTPPLLWISSMIPWLRHIHLHNNWGDRDLHLPLDEGNIPTEKVLCKLIAQVPEVTYTLESSMAAPSVDFLFLHGFLEKERI